MVSTKGAERERISLIKRLIKEIRTVALCAFGVALGLAF